MKVEKVNMYYQQSGKDTTDQTPKLTAGRMQALGIDGVVVASSTGWTAYKAMEIFANRELFDDIYCRHIS
jgi:hypothetical protein